MSGINFQNKENASAAGERVGGPLEFDLVLVTMTKSNIPQAKRSLII